MPRISIHYFCCELIVTDEKLTSLLSVLLTVVFLGLRWAWEVATSSSAPYSTHCLLARLP